MECEYKSGYPKGLDCKLHSLPGEKYCIIHKSFPKDRDKLSDVVKQKVDNNDFDFEGAKLYEFIYPDQITTKQVRFRNAIVKGDVKLSSDYNNAELGRVNFRGADISGRVKFNVVKIKGKVDFGNDTKIGGNLEFGSSIIEGDAIFMDITVGGNVLFPYSIINGNVNFENAKIKKELIFTNSEIDKNVIFDKIKVDGNLFFNFNLKEVNLLKNIRKGKKLEIKGTADFDKVTIGGKANFDGINVGNHFLLSSSYIGGSINFEEARIGTNLESNADKNAEFINTKILGEADFTRSEFFGDVSFFRTFFRENAYFDSTIFNEIADFGEARFYGNANFINTNFRNVSNFARASFLSTGLFDGLENNLKLDSSFEGCRLRNVAFRGCDLTDTRFRYVIFDNCELSSSIWPEDYKIPEFIEYEKNKFKKVPINSLFTNSLGILWSPELVKEADDLIVEIKKILPKWVRTMRIQRDIPSQLIEAGVKKSNLGELVYEKLHEQKINCQCIRCREVGHKAFFRINPDMDNIKLLKEEYDAGEGREIFLSFEDIKKDILIGFLRLRIPSVNAHRSEIDEKTALIRELHVYGPMAPLGKKKDYLWQHRGFGEDLLTEAEKIASEIYDKEKMVINSGIGARNYYRKFGYKVDGPYMSKLL